MYFLNSRHTRGPLATALSTFLEICQRPETIRIALFDAPAVLGWQAWRELEARHGLGLERARETGLIVAHTDDKYTARTKTQESLLLLVSGLLR